MSDLYRGKEKWINANTGEQIEVDKTVKKAGRQGFMITYLSSIVRLIDTLGNKKMEVVKYILDNMELSNNTLIATQKEIAKKCQVSRPTVSKTLKLLDEANIIQKRVGSIILHPKLAHRGSEEKEKYLLTKFTQFEEDNNE